MALQNRKMKYKADTETRIRRQARTDARVRPPAVVGAVIIRRRR